MPSRSRIVARDKMLPEVEMLMDAHSTLRKGKKGPDNHNSVLRSSIVMLCATWELYCESVVAEVAFKILKKIEKVDVLPEAIKKQLIQAVYHENVWKSDPLKLAGTGWKLVHIEIVRMKCRELNTPKSENLDDLFKQCLGFKDISKCWSYGSGEIDKLVRLRGSIAHRGSDAEKVSRETAAHFKSVISKSISETDDALYDYLKLPHFLNAAPWQKTAKS